MRSKAWPVVAMTALLSVSAWWAQTSTLERYAHVGMYLPIPEQLWLQLVVGWAFVIAGLLARRHRPDSRIGSLLALFALVWIGRLSFVAPSIQFEAIGWGVAFYGVLFLILFTFPTGSLTGWERWAAAGWVSLVVVLSVLSVALTDFYAGVDVDGCCPSHILLIGDDREMRELIFAGGGSAAAVVFTGIVVRQFLRWRRATFVGRRRLSTLGVALGPLMVLLVLVPTAGLISPSGFDSYIPDRWVRLDVYVQSAALVVLPGVILVELLRTRLSQAKVGDMLQSLVNTMAPGELETRLRQTLGDPTARLVFHRDESTERVDVDGQLISHESLEHSTVTSLDDHVALAHDPAVDPDLALSAGAAARLSVDNARLQAELRAQLREVQESRRRLVTAGDDARRRVERDLHDGAQQRLVVLAASLRTAHRRGTDAEVEQLLIAAAQETEAAIGELRDLAQGVHPAILTQAGLNAAVASLADRAPLPVTVSIGPDRWPEEVETTAYFVIAEALSNSFKHSGAHQIDVTVVTEDDALLVTVDDDGRGGADPTGTGIRGMVDRVQAIGGRLHVGRGPIGGTRLLARLPLTDQAS